MHSVGRARRDIATSCYAHHARPMHDDPDDERAFELRMAQREAADLELATGRALEVYRILRELDELEPRTDLARQYLAALRAKSDA